MGNRDSLTKPTENIKMITYDNITILSSKPDIPVTCICHITLCSANIFSKLLNMKSPKMYSAENTLPRNTRTTLSYLRQEQCHFASVDRTPTLITLACFAKTNLTSQVTFSYAQKTQPAWIKQLSASSPLKQLLCFCFLCIQLTFLKQIQVQITESCRYQDFKKEFDIGALIAISWACVRINLECYSVAL